jgi:hypothetical protein
MQKSIVPDIPESFIIIILAKYPTSFYFCLRFSQPAYCRLQYAYFRQFLPGIRHSLILISSAYYYYQYAVRVEYMRLNATKDTSQPTNMMNVMSVMKPAAI